MTDHENQVKEFFAQAKKDNPDRYKEVCDEFPIVTEQRLKTIRAFEKTAGLVGFEPVMISVGEADRANIESDQSER